VESKHPRAARRDQESYRFATEFLTALGSPLAGAARARDGLRLASATVDYTEPCTSTFRDSYWAAEAFSKLPWELDGVDRDEVAYQKFWEAEEKCRDANSRLVDWQNRPHLDVMRLKHARQLIAAVLGDFSWDHCEPFFSFGPGASTSLPRRKAQRSNKWEFGAHITRQCLPLLITFCRKTCRRGDLGKIPCWDFLLPAERELLETYRYDQKCLIVSGNRVTTVPKNAKTNRVIAIEPDWNMFFQRGIGGAIRHRLRSRLGILRPDSQQIHQDLARRGSADGSLATIDLQSASDSVSLALVEALLPSDWFSAMYLTRSHQGEIDGKTVLYEKISSMGNGYTFELETLIFWALTRACCKASDTLSVYGDDIICPVDSAPAAIKLLMQCGFNINAKKTFLSGPFRESCGGHFHNGRNVTPPYFREHLSDDIVVAIRTANRIRRAASQRFGFSLDGRFLSVWQRIAALVPKDLWGPPVLGDAVLHASFDEVKPKRWKRYFAFQLWGMLPKTSRQRTDHMGAVYNALYGEPTEESSFTKHEGTYRKRKLRTPVYRWEDPGVWLTPDTLTET
jgi:hypothetical protein